MNLLHIDSSILGDHSVSRKVSSAVVEKLRHQHPQLEVVYRDVAADPVPAVSGLTLSAAFVPADQHSPALQQDLAQGTAVVDEFLAADIVVIGAPMYNFTIPVQLKAWVDRVAVAGKTFRYTAAGVEGLAGNKRVILASAQGGHYDADGPRAALEHQESYLRSILGFLGISHIDVVRAAGVNLGPEQKQQGVDAALAQVAALA